MRVQITRELPKFEMQAGHEECRHISCLAGHAWGVVTKDIIPILGYKTL